MGDSMLFFRLRNLLGLSWFFLASAALALEAGQQAPDFELPGRQQLLRLSDFKGKIVYVDFWASWCGPCKQSFPWMNEIFNKYRAQGFELLAINVDKKKDDALAFERIAQVSFDIAYDPSGVTPKSYGIKAMPTSFLIGRDGRVMKIHSGFRAQERAELEAYIQSKLEAK